jgi:hypothetical protein
MNPEDPVTVYEAWDPRQAHLICQVLANADIEARVASDALEVGLGDIPFQHTTCPVMVRRADFERAREVMAEFDSRLAGGAAAEGEESQPYCYHCGESVTAGEARCPKCGQELDWTV